MPIWLTIILALPQIISFFKEIYDLWQKMREVPVEQKKEATADFKATVQMMKLAKDDHEKRHLLERLKERLHARCAQ